MIYDCDREHLFKQNGSEKKKRSVINLIGVVEFVVHEASDDAGFADGLIAQEHQLVLGKSWHWRHFKSKSDEGLQIARDNRENEPATPDLIWFDLIWFLLRCFFTVLLLYVSNQIQLTSLNFPFFISLSWPMFLKALDFTTL